MSQEESHSGIPTRAIHEAYLDMQRSLKAYREAKDQGNDQALERAHGELQQNVLTFYDLLRPHLKSESAVEGYWHGEPPSYNHNGRPPDNTEGKGILQVQTEREPYGLNNLNGTDPQELDTLADWHEAIGLGPNVRIIGVSGQGNSAFITYEMYEMGLRKLDDWETDYKRTTKKKEGFQTGTETEVKRIRVPIDRLKRAARELSEVADNLGALSDFDASEPRTEIPKELIEEVAEWQKENIK